MTVVFQRPYKFVPPYRGDGWPNLIQRLHLVDRYLRSKDGVVDYECRNLELWKASLDRGDGIILAPNHCRYADPLVLGWPAREAKVHLHALASWHLFNKGWFDSFAIRRMGAYSINREATDRKAIEASIEIVSAAERPLIIFPEGYTTRTNDVLQPMLEGMTFIARVAARRRAKHQSGNVVIQPVAIKYLCVDDVESWTREHLSELEARLAFRSSPPDRLLDRILRLLEGLLALKEVEYLGRSMPGDLPERKDRLVQHVLQTAESRCQLTSTDDDTIRERVRAIRIHTYNQFFNPNTDQAEKERLRNDAKSADLAQELLSYPINYLHPDHVTDSRAIETVQRLQESFLGKAKYTTPLRSVIEFGEAIPVPAEKVPRGQSDPLLAEISDRLHRMLDPLTKESQPFTM